MRLLLVACLLISSGCTYLEISLGVAIVGGGLIEAIQQANEKKGDSDGKEESSPEKEGEAQSSVQPNA